MMDLALPLQKMKAELGTPIQYEHRVDPAFRGLEVPESIRINEVLFRRHTLEFQNQYRCFCGELKSRVYQRNFCRSCFFELPQASQSIFKPELSKAHLGIFERDEKWEREVHLVPHYVYLAITGGQVKVGVTRFNQIPTRWIDQGASAGLIIAEVPHRHAAGVIEVALKKLVNDKTNWRRMLSDAQVDASILLEQRSQLLPHVPADHQQFVLADKMPMILDFPMGQFPAKIKSINLEKTPQYSGVLIGVKGQYLIFEDGSVLNVRGNEGKIVRWRIE